MYILQLLDTLNLFCHLVSKKLDLQMIELKYKKMAGQLINGYDASEIQITFIPRLVFIVHIQI